jgi:predicted nuclease with RNAse H fold
MNISKPVRLIGVDWATEECKRGVAVVDWNGLSATVVELSACHARRRALEVIDAAIAGSERSVIAVDAPFGWPMALSRALLDHDAGTRLGVEPDDMFSRATDRFVRQTLGKKPLEVGANFIARTAHSANEFLNEFREKSGRALPLLWAPDELIEHGVIEVYPAATKIAVGHVSPATLLGVQDGLLFQTAHVADALWCAVAALHFVRGECYPPTDPAISKREGWIWVKRTAEEQPAARLQCAAGRANGT